MNRVILIGHIGQDAEIRTTQNGNTVANFSLATSKKMKGETETQWHRISLWGKAAEAVGPYLKKGKQISIEGEIQYGSYENKEGQKVYTTTINAYQVELLSSKSDSNPEPQNQKPEYTEDDIPF